MKITHSRETLLDALQAAMGAIEKRHTSPILENILLQVRNSRIYWRGTNMELEISASLPVIDATEGEITIPARKLFDICKSLPAESMVGIDLIEGNRALVTSGRSRFELVTLPAHDFPDLDDIGEYQQVEIPENIFKQMLDNVAFAMANQDVRYYLNGTLLEISANQLRTVATDGHRLSVYTHEGGTGIAEPTQAIIPRKSIMELSKLLSADRQIPVVLQLSNNHLRVQLDSLRFTTKLVDGRYPDYQAAIPPHGHIAIEVDRKEFRDVLARVAILSNEKFRGVRLNLRENKLVVQSNNPEQEMAQDEIDVLYQGDEFSIGFNVTYLLDAINHMSNDSITIHLNSPENSALITDPSEPSINNVVMPIRL